jgi:hypothetical protein
MLRWCVCQKISSRIWGSLNRLCGSYTSFGDFLWFFLGYFWVVALEVGNLTTPPPAHTTHTHTQYTIHTHTHIHTHTNTHTFWCTTSLVELENRVRSPLLVICCELTLRLKGIWKMRRSKNRGAWSGMKSKTMSQIIKEIRVSKIQNRPNAARIYAKK